MDKIEKSHTRTHAQIVKYVTLEKITQIRLSGHTRQLSNMSYVPIFFCLEIED